MTSGLVIRTRELGGKIVTLGDSHARGIVVESPDFTSNDWGPESGQFVLKRSPRVQWPDLRANAPLIAYDRGVEVWRGRIKQTPQTDGGLARSISVNAEGAQFRLDDDAYERLYVATDLALWKDERSRDNAALGSPGLCAAGQVTIEGGAVTMSLPKGYVAAAGDIVGVQFDAGPTAGINDLSFLLTTSNNFTGFTICRAYWSNDNFATFTNVFSRFIDITAPPGIGPGPIAYTSMPLLSGVNARYLCVQIEVLSAFTLTADSFVCIKAAGVYGAAAYNGGGFSTLKAGAVVQDAIDKATMLLASDRSLLTPTAFNIPECDLSGPTTPREVITGVNVFHDYQARINADNRPEYRPRPALPTIDVGADSKFDEASAGDASEVYTTVVVVYTDATGVEQRLTVNQSSGILTTSALQPTNPSALAATTGWTADLGTLTRDTVVFDSAPASFKLAFAVSAFDYHGHMFSNAWTAGTWRTDKVYTLTGRVRNDSPPVGQGAIIALADGTTGAFIGTANVAMVANTQTPFSLSYILRTAVAPTILVGLFGAGVGGNGWLDTLVNYEASPTIVDQWGFKRTKILQTGMSLTPAGAQQIADTFLLGHRTTPLKGTLVVTGDGRARRSPSGAPMRASDLLGSVGELVRLRHLIDPETGKVGRIGRIASASWDAGARAARLEIDSTTRNFEAMLARLAIITSQVRA